jgi:pimeloyl-ACP methyl ester carboxylesterase
MLPRAHRRRGVIVKNLAVGLVATAFVGALYKQEARRQDRKRFPQIGQSVDIGGRSLNIYCSGEGSPAVILESGKGSPGYSWVFVQREIAQFTRACWYDRSGYGWSDSGPYPQNSAATARELHELLRRAAIQPPYVLVGHSLGGFHVRVYNGLYPNDLAGMVLVDSSHEDEGSRIPRNRGRSHPTYLRRPFSLLAETANELGLLRVLARHRGSDFHPVGITTGEWSIISGLASEPRMMAATAKECQGGCGEEARSAGGLGDRPLIVLTAGKRTVRSPEDEEDRESWIRLQSQLVQLSTRGRQVVVRNSGHMIPYEAPEEIIGAVREVITQAWKTR